MLAEHSRVRALRRYRPDGDPVLVAAQARLAVAVAVDKVRRAVDELDLADLTDEQRRELAELGRRLIAGGER